MFSPTSMMRRRLSLDSVGGTAETVTARMRADRMTSVIFILKHTGQTILLEEESSRRDFL